MKRIWSDSTVVDLGYPASTICTNRDVSRIAVAGRKLFKIFEVDQEQIKSVANIRDLPQKQINLNFSSNHVQWNPRDDNQLASAPTNGSVVLWDLNKTSKSKIAHVFDQLHERAVNRICYHPRDANLLISGSQDSKLKCLDTRQRSVVNCYCGPDSVRDVQYSPHNDNLFVAAYESGVCQVWDRRNPDIARRQVNAHMGPAYTCAWHLEIENRFLSAGRDKTIKVFDSQSADHKPNQVYLISALFSIARARWRPRHKDHVASCSHLLDNSVAVWDIRRPYIQYAAFVEHTDDVADFLWLSENVLVSCGKDGKLIRRRMKMATHPTDRAAPVSVSLRPDGCGLTLSSSDSISQKSKIYQPLSSSRNPAQFRKQDVDPYQQHFLKNTSFLQEHQRVKDVWFTNFKTCAKEFMFEGLPTDQLCDHNYKVCEKIGRKDEAQTWLILKLLYCGWSSGCSCLGLLPIHNACTPEQRDGLIHAQSLNSVEKEKSEEASTDKKKGSTEDVLLMEEENRDFTGMLEFFEQNENDSDSSSTTGSTQPELELPKEPFQLRQDIVSKTHLEVPEMESVSFSAPGSQVSGTSLPPSPLAFSASSQASHLPGVPHSSWDFRSQVAAMLNYYAEKGDVQMSVSIILVFGMNVLKLVPEPLIVQWFLSYIEILRQFQLLSEAALIINRCPLKEVNETSQQSTLYPIGCGRCNKVLPTKSSNCQKCDAHLSVCSVCHITVRGLFSWCDICGHGGHYKHLLNWFNSNLMCPAGCGHQCMVNN